MQEDYKTILATCIRLKDSTMTRQSLISGDKLYQVFLPLLKEVDCLIAALPIELAVQKAFLESDRASSVLGGVVSNFGLGKLVSDLDNLNAIVNSGNQTPVRTLPENKGTCKKIFISHSSKDIMIVDAFVTLLTRGAGLSQKDIFCSSIDGMKIKNGEDMRKRIQENVNGADFAILMVSKNYKASEVCLNEMGAVWAIGKKVKAYVFPDLQEERVGWLINDKAAEKLNDETALASLYEELQQFYKLPLSLPGWTAQAKAFRETFKQNQGVGQSSSNP